MRYFLEYRKKIWELNLEIKDDSDYNEKKKIIRNPNFPSELSENLVLFCYNELFNVRMEWKVGLR